MRIDRNPGIASGFFLYSHFLRRFNADCLCDRSNTDAECVKLF